MTKQRSFHCLLQFQGQEQQLDRLMESPRVRYSNKTKEDKVVGLIGLIILFFFFYYKRLEKHRKRCDTARFLVFYTLKQKLLKYTFSRKKNGLFSVHSQEVMGFQSKHNQISPNSGNQEFLLSSFGFTLQQLMKS